MPRITTSPFLKASADNVRTLAWSMSAGEILPEELRGWDPTVSIQAAATIEVNLTGVREDCQLVRDTELALTPVWSSRGTGLRGSGG